MPRVNRRTQASTPKEMPSLLGLKEDETLVVTVCICYFEKQICIILNTKKEKRFKWQVKINWGKCHWDIVCRSISQLTL